VARGIEADWPRRIAARFTRARCGGAVRARFDLSFDLAETNRFLEISLSLISGKTGVVSRPFVGALRPHIRVDPHILEGSAGLSEQLALFADRSPEPEGLRYAAEFISPMVERELIGHISALPLQPFQFGAYEGKRRVASFGFRYDYTMRRLLEAEPIPDWLVSLIGKVEAFGGPDTRIRQVLCTEYDTGVGIGWHRDKPHFDRIFGLSLGSPCKLRFRKPSAAKWDRFTLDAEPRSLYMLACAARQIWEHSIPAVEAPRYSITFRTMVDPTS
jgi:alkylated DNA repair dioxygenase AlkB